jgi:hypothetical protein
MSTPHATQADTLRQAHQSAWERRERAQRGSKTRAQFLLEQANLLLLQAETVVELPQLPLKGN